MRAACVSVPSWLLTSIRPNQYNIIAHVWRLVFAWCLQLISKRQLRRTDSTSVEQPAAESPAARAPAADGTNVLHDKKTDPAVVKKKEASTRCVDNIAV